MVKIFQKIVFCFFWGRIRPIVDPLQWTAPIKQRAFLYPCSIVSLSSSLSLSLSISLSSFRFFDPRPSLIPRMDALDSVVDPLREFAKDSLRLVKRCHKPDRKGELRSARFGFFCMQ